MGVTFRNTKMCCHQKNTEAHVKSKMAILTLVPVCHLTSLWYISRSCRCTSSCTLMWGANCGSCTLGKCAATGGFLPTCWVSPSSNELEITAESKGRRPSTSYFKAGVSNWIPKGPSVCRFFWFPFNQLSIKACRPRCVHYLANQWLEWTKGAENNQKTSRHSGPPGLESDTCALK